MITIGLMLNLSMIVAFGAAAVYSEGWYRLVALGLLAFALDRLRLELDEQQRHPEPPPS